MLNSTSRARKNRICLCLALLLLGACRSVQPLQRAMAGLYPTVDISISLDELQAWQGEAEILKRALQEMKLWPMLEQAGLPENELQLLHRGLTEHGYAEIDLRRTNSPLIWVNFNSKNGETLEIGAAFHHLPPPECRNHKKLEPGEAEQKTRYVRRNQRLEAQSILLWKLPELKNHSRICLVYRQQQAGKISHYEMKSSFEKTSLAPLPE
ncbi:MAG: hypothetical protein PHG44_01110 [Lentisphaeria bacterium]|nr:hypothetical protein [Lentisphaeria bacterium]